MFWPHEDSPAYYKVSPHLDPYDDLDMMPSAAASYTDKKYDPQTVNDYVEFVKMGNQIKVNLVRSTKEETSIYLLRVLRSIINEQVLADLLDQDTGDYIYESVKIAAFERLK